jgi:CHASE2 domain-containing sensor protein
MQTKQKGQNYNLLEAFKKLLFPSQPLPHIFLNLVTTQNWRSPEFQDQSSDQRSLQIIASLQINRYEVVSPTIIDCPLDLLANFGDWFKNYTQYAIDYAQYALRDDVDNTGDQSNRSSNNFRQFEVNEDEEESSSRREYSIEEAAARVKRSIDYLFNKSEGFKKIRDQLIQVLPPKGQPQPNVYIRYDNPQLAELPLHLWNEFQERNIEPVFCSQEARIQNISFKKKRKPRILLILGDFIDIDNDKDKLTWIEQYPDAEIEVLEMLNKRGVSDAIWKGKWDVLYFGGHSSTEDGKGIIYLKNDVRVTLSEFKNGLAEAAKNGLQLAIFNSCISLGAAADLQSAGVPMVVATRHKMHNLIAPEFLELFLDAYINIGKSIKDAVWYAKERLRTDSNRYFPCADLLPVVFQIPTTPARLKPLPLTTFLIAFIVGIVIFNIHIFGLFGFPKAEAALYDHIMQSRPTKELDSRIAIVKISNQDKKFQTDQGAKLQGDESIDDEHLVKLISELKQSGAKTIAMNLGRYYSVSTSPDAKKSLDELISSSPNLVTSCQLPVDTKVPDRVSPEILNRQKKIQIQKSEWGDYRVGFSNILSDSKLGNVVRRILLMANLEQPSQCNNITRISFPLQVVLNYLDVAGSDVDEKYNDTNGHEVLKFRDSRFKNVTITNIVKLQGGYTIAPSIEPKELENLTILLNFKNQSSDIPYTQQIFSLQEIISGRHDSFKDKIVLIVGSNNENFTMFSSKDDSLSTSSADIYIQAIDYLLRIMEGYPVLNGMTSLEFIPIYAIFLIACALVCFYIFGLSQTPNFFAMAVSGATIVESLIGYYVSYNLLSWGIYWMPTIPFLSSVLLVNLSLVIYFTTCLSWKYQNTLDKTPEKLAQS